MIPSPYVAGRRARAASAMLDENPHRDPAAAADYDAGWRWQNYLIWRAENSNRDLRRPRGPASRRAAAS